MKKPVSFKRERPKMHEMMVRQRHMTHQVFREMHLAHEHLRGIHETRMSRH